MTKKVQSNLLKQNVYIRENIPEVSCCLDSVKKYYDIQRVTDPVKNVVEDKIIERDYPITPDYVNSFSDCDYHNDVTGAMAYSANNPKQNLGDVTSLQDVANMDDTQRMAIIEKLLTDLNEAEVKPDAEVKKEVKTDV
ncbi:hypothetical protein [Dipodfec virus UOA04_Rod_708]|nr:hypothetical protein [Dipodfec virus UOA04_Rod_708]